MFLIKKVIENLKEGRTSTLTGLRYDYKSLWNIDSITSDVAILEKAFKMPRVVLNIVEEFLSATMCGPVKICNTHNEKVLDFSEAPMPIPGNVLAGSIEVEHDQCAGLILVETNTAMTQLKEEQKTRHYICLYLHGTPCIAVRILAARISGIIQHKFKGLISDCGYGGLQIHKLVKHGTPSEEDYPVNRTVPDLVHLGVLPSDIEKYFSKPDCTKQDLTPSARASLESMKRWYIENQLELDVVPEIQLLIQSMKTMERKKLTT